MITNGIIGKSMTQLGSPRMAHNFMTVIKAGLASVTNRLRAATATMPCRSASAEERPRSEERQQSRCAAEAAT